MTHHKKRTKYRNKYRETIAKICLYLHFIAHFFPISIHFLCALNEIIGLFSVDWFIVYEVGSFYNFHIQFILLSNKKKEDFFCSWMERSVSCGIMSKSDRSFLKL